MIFVALGTQDKKFPRLLEAVNKLETNEKIVAQVGSTKFESKKMEIHKYLTPEEYDKYLNEASVVITHAGVGTILNCIKLHKKVIVAAREKQYKEHVNDHQKQIQENFATAGYILPLYDFNDLEKLIKQDFVPKSFESNREKFNELLEKKINEK